MKIEEITPEMILAQLKGMCEIPQDSSSEAEAVIELLNWASQCKELQNHVELNAILVFTVLYEKLRSKNIPIAIWMVGLLHGLKMAHDLEAIKELNKISLQE